MTPPTVPFPLFPSITAICQAQPVVLAYLFGSYARGTADAESDVDLAILADPLLTRSQRRELRFLLMCQFADALRLPLERLDLIVLQDVPILLQHNVVRGGQILFAADADTRREFEIGVECAYDDEAPALARDAERTLERLLSPAA